MTTGLKKPVQKKPEPKVEQKPVIQEVKKVEVKKLVSIKGTDIEKIYTDLMFTRDKMDKKLDRPKGDIVDEFVKEYNNPKICETIVEPKFRMRTIFTNLFRRYQPIIKSNASIGTMFFSNKYSDKEPRDTNANKKFDDPTLKENWVLNVMGCVFDKNTGSLVPLVATIWGETAASVIPKDSWIKVQYVPNNRGNDEPKYRDITIRKIVGVDKLIYQNKEVSVPSDMSKYVPTIPAQESEAYVGKVVNAIGRVITFNDKVTGKGNYSITISSADPIETSMDDMVSVMAVSKMKPVWEQDSQVMVTGKIMAPREEKEDIIDDASFEVVGGDVTDGTEPLPEEPEEPKGKMFSVFDAKVEPVGVEGKDWTKAKSNEISASGSFEDYSDTDFESEIKTTEEVSDEPEVVTSESDDVEEQFNLDE